MARAVTTRGLRPCRAKEPGESRPGSYPAPAARGGQAPRPGRGIPYRYRPQLQCKPEHDFEAGELTSLLFIIGLIILIPCAVAFNRAQRRLKEWGVPRAVEIARYQGWVSPYRLMNQAHLTKNDAQLVLREACKQGYLYQAVNGRYYIGPPPR